MAITRISISSSTGISTSTNSIANNGTTDTAFGLSSLSLRSEREEREGVLSWQHKLKKVHKEARKRLNLHFLIVRKNGKVDDIH